MGTLGNVSVPKVQRFKYLTFNQCVAKLGGDNAKFSGKLMCRTEDSESLFFTQALTKWNDIHFGIQYTSFVDSLPCDELHSIAQLLHHKKHIIQSLLKNLNDPECKSAEAFCELLSALVRDLKEDCREDIWDVIEALINVLDFGERNIESVQAAFYSLSLVVKLMWKTLVRDLSSSFIRFIPLLGSSRWYARRFAAECFSFIIRKSKNLTKISGHIVEQAYKVKDDRLVEGCAELFFFVPKGVLGGFHSTAKEKIGCMVSGILLLPNSDVREYGVTILEKTVQLIVQYVQKGSKADLLPLEVSLLNMLGGLNSMDLVTHVTRLLRLCFVQRKWVNMFSSNNMLLSMIEKVLASPFFEINSLFMEFLTQCVLQVFDKAEWGASVGNICSTLIFKRGNYSSLFPFFNDSIDVIYFDEHILPTIGKLSSVVFAQEHDLVIHLLNLYSAVCLNRQPLNNILHEDIVTVLDISIHMSLRQYIIEKISNLGLTEKSIAASILIIWPWIRTPTDGTTDISSVVQYLNDLVDGSDYSVEASQIALIAVSSLFRVDRYSIKKIDICKVEQFVRNMKCRESSLRFYRLCLEVNESLSTENTLKRVSDVLLPCYFHPNSSVRRIALELLNSFNIVVEGLEVEHENVFGVLLAAECCDIIDSRGRLLHFNRLTFTSHKRFSPRGSGTTYDHVILRIAIAQFFVQFTKLWMSMYEFLESFARGMNIDEFWSIITEVFERVNTGCRDQSTSPGESCILPWCDRDDRVDYYSARIQILRFIGKIWDLGQRRTRILSPIFLEFYEIEYLPFITECITSCKLSPPETTSILSANEPEEKCLDKRDLYASLTKTLCAFLDIYAKFTDPKSVYLESKIRNMYDHLLISGNDVVQKLVMECIFSYKDKALLPYQENFERLLNEKFFREQLVLFSINEGEGNSIVHSDHRRTVIYILLRLLYGKLWSPTKRNMIESKRAAIFRYIGGCRPDELLDFMRILFAPILEVIGTVEMDFKKMEVLCNDDQALFKVDFSRMKRCLSSVSNMLVRIACVIVDEQRTMLFRLLLATAVAIKAAIVHPKMPVYLSHRIRDLRTSLTDRFGEFLAAYPQRSFIDSELEGLLSYMVQPYLSEARSILGESIVIPPLSVVKILAAVSAYPTHYHILALRYEWKCRNGALMQLLVSPLLWPGLTRRMSNVITKALLNLLTLADEEMTYSECKYAVIPLQKGSSYGTSLVVEHINPVIQFLSNSIQTSAKKFDMTNLELLCRLSGHSVDETIAGSIIFTILSRLEKKLPKESTLKKLLDVIACLMGEVTDPRKFFRRIGPLFSKVEGRLSRQALVRISEVLALNRNVPDDIRDHLCLVADLESWDRSRIDEPDHDRRHSAYARLHSIVDADAVVDLDIIKIFVHLHFHTFSTTKEFSLRTSSAASLRALIEYVSRNLFEESEKACFVNSDVIHVLLNGMRSHIEIVREECIRCFSHLVDRFPDHAHLKQLSQLRNLDEDLDFFTNIIHIQLHRRQRAVHRLVEQLCFGKVIIGFDILNKYLVPIIHPYLMDTESKVSALSDECLRLLNYVMGIAPWSKYVSCLDLWLKRLDKPDGNHKAVIRAIVSVVDAFHYQVAAIGETPDQEERNDMRFIIRDKLVRDVLPRLTSCINGSSAALSVHRKARTTTTKYYSEDDDIRRAPVALAIVKLLRKVPESICRQYLHGVVLKLCFLMISRSIDVRDTARKVALQVCEFLGPRYLPVIIKEMKLIMTKGFQVHVMIYTVHTLIAAMQQFLSNGDLDPCLDDVLDVVVQEQFGSVSEEKEVGEIKSEVGEAKRNCGPGTLQLLGRFISSSAVGLVLKRFEYEVSTLTSSKTISRARHLLSMFAIGLRDNKGFPPSVQLILIHQVLLTNIDKVKAVPISQCEVVDNVERPKSCFLLPLEPRRIGVLKKAPLKNRCHIFVEFALQLLGALITGKQFKRDDPDHVSRLEPFLYLLTQCLQLKYEKVISHALRCLVGLSHMALPSVLSSLDVLSKRLFLLLSEYSITGSSSNKEYMLINQLLCKTFTQLIVISNTSFLTDEYISLLLSYVEIDVLDANRQATAFSLIKALVRKKVQHPQIPGIVKKLREMSVTSPFNHVRTQCREVLCEFIGNHPGSGDPQKHIEWFIAQLGYEFEDGRLSAADMLHSLFSRLQPSALNSFCFFNVSKLGTSLFNEESPKCRRFISSSIHKLLESVSESTRLDVFSACCDWLELQEQAQEGARSTAVDLLVQLSRIEGEAFCSKFCIVIPFLRRILMDSESLCSNNSERTISGFCYGIASILQNLSSSASVVFLMSDFAMIIDSLEPLMKCEGSLAVRLSTACLIGQCLNSYESALFTPERSMTLIQWCSWQLRDRMLNEDIAFQASKILMAISRHLNDDQFSVLLDRLANICRYEIINQPNLFLKRITCFKIAAALVLREESSSKLDVAMQFFLPLLLREMRRKPSKDGEELYSVSMEVSEIFKSKIGERKYSTLFAEYQKAAVSKADQRKRKLKALSLTNPEEAALLKRRKTAKKVQSRKRKIDALKPYRITYRKHAKQMRTEQDER